MTIIDQSILIPTSPAVVWEIISDIDSNTRWQADYQSVSFLTSMRSGSGVRWRYSSPGGNDFVVETTAWYDGIGYEYTFIDGAPFRESKGRLRLQEIAEGTIVQWSLEYEMGGVLAGMRNSLSVRRQYEKLMVNSLRGLWTFIKETGRTRQSHEAKSLMRDAPDYEERAQYTPRHPSRTSDREDESPLIDDPPLSDEDTRPNPAIADAEPEKPVKEQGWIEMKPVQIERGAAADTDENEKVQADDYRRFQPPPAAADDLEILVGPDPEPTVTTMTETTTDVSSDTDDLDATTVLPELAEAEAQEIEPAEADDFGPKIDTSKLDTREVSIWEVFGVPSPSETQRMRAIKVDEQGEPLENQEDSQALQAVDEAEASAPESPPAPAEANEEREPDFQIAPTPEIIKADESEDSAAPPPAAESVTPDFQIAPTPEVTRTVEPDVPAAPPPAAESPEPDVQIAPTPAAKPAVEVAPPAIPVSAQTVTRPALAPVTEPLIAGYRISLRRRLVKIRRHR